MIECPHCHESSATEAQFCEHCGACLHGCPSVQPGVIQGAGANSAHAAAGPCLHCGAGPTEIDEEGFCKGCGLRRNGMSRAHDEILVDAQLGGITDQGLRHTRNEDAIALATVAANGTRTAIAVVCDGVSSSHDANQAATLAAAAARESLLQAAIDGRPDEDAMKDAIRRAHLAICDHLCDSNELKDPPGTTIAALMAGPDRAVVGWVGDSRVYLFSPGDSRQLTHDHSWITETVDSGDMTEEQALRSPLAHAITRCLGPLDEDDPGESPEPGIVSIDLPHPCRLLVCSDGFWNDVPGASEIEELMKTAPEGADLLAACRRLVDHALQCGGRDNISVIIADFVAGSGPIAANVSGLPKREEFSNGV